MTTKPTKTKAIQAQSKSTMTAEQRVVAFTKLATIPTYNGAAVAQSFSIHGQLDYVTLEDALTAQCRRVHGGDLKRAESILTAQAHSLDAIFANLARRAALNMGEYIGAAETYLKLALRAQSQCRATLETLAAIKSPPVVFAKQANIAHGHQQVNNSTGEPARVEEIKKPPTELLEHDHGQRQDTRTARTATAAIKQWQPWKQSTGPRSGVRQGSCRVVCYAAFFRVGRSGLR